MTTRFVTEGRSALTPTSYQDLLAAGITRGRLAGPHWERPQRGRYRALLDPTTPAQRILDAVGELPAGGALGGWAAAYVQGCDWLDGRDAVTGREFPVLLCVGSAVHRTARRGIRWTRSPLHPSEVRVVFGLPVTRGPRTALDGARTARTAEEALVVLDALTSHGLVTPAELDRAACTYRGRAGVARLTRLAPLAEPDVRSPWETRLRWCWTQQVGLPDPLVNPPVYDLAGRLLGLPDLLDVEAGLAVEFDGDHHRVREQHHLDNHREERFEGHGMVVIRIDSLDLRDRSAMARRLRAARARALAHPRPVGWTLTRPTTESVELLQVSCASEPERARPIPGGGVSGRAIRWRAGRS